MRRLIGRRPLLSLPLLTSDTNLHINSSHNTSSYAPVSSLHFQRRFISTRQVTSILHAPKKASSLANLAEDDDDAQDLETSALLQNASSVLKSSGAQPTANNGLRVMDDDYDTMLGIEDTTVDAQNQPTSSLNIMSDTQVDEPSVIVSVADEALGDLGASSDEITSSTTAQSIERDSTNGTDIQDQSVQSDTSPTIFADLDKLVVDAQAAEDFPEKGEKQATVSKTQQELLINDNELENLLDDISFILPTASSRSKGEGELLQHNSAHDRDVNTVDQPIDIGHSIEDTIIIDDDEGVTAARPMAPARQTPLHINRVGDAVDLSEAANTTEPESISRKIDVEMDQRFTTEKFHVNPRPLCRGIVVAWYPNSGYGYIADKEDLDAQEEFIYQSAALSNLKMAIATGSGSEVSSNPLAGIFKVYKVSNTSIRFTHKNQLPPLYHTLHVFREVEFDKAASASDMTAAATVAKIPEMIYAKNVCDMGGFTLPPGPENPQILEAVQDADANQKSTTKSPSSRLIAAAGNQLASTSGQPNIIYSGHSEKTPNSGFRQDFYTMPRDLHDEDTLRMVKKLEDGETSDGFEAIECSTPSRFVNKMASLFTPVGRRGEAENDEPTQFEDPLAVQAQKNPRSMMSRPIEKKKVEKKQKEEAKRKKRAEAKKTATPKRSTALRSTIKK